MIENDVEQVSFCYIVKKKTVGIFDPLQNVFGLLCCVLLT